MNNRDLYDALAGMNDKLDQLLAMTATPPEVTKQDLADTLDRIHNQVKGLVQP